MMSVIVCECFIRPRDLYGVRVHVCVNLCCFENEDTYILSAILLNIAAN